MHYKTMNIANGDNAGDIRGDNTSGKEDIKHCYRTYERNAINYSGKVIGENEDI